MLWRRYCPILLWRGRYTVLLGWIGRWRLCTVSRRLAVEVLWGGGRLGPSALMGGQVHAGGKRCSAIRLRRSGAIHGRRRPVPARRWSVGLCVIGGRRLGGPACILWVSVLRRGLLLLLLRRRRLGVVRGHRGTLMVPGPAPCQGRTAPGGATGGCRKARSRGRWPSGIKLLLLPPAPPAASPPCTSASSASSSPTAGSISLAAATAAAAPVQPQHGRHLRGCGMGLETWRWGGARPAPPGPAPAPATTLLLHCRCRSGPGFGIPLGLTLCLQLPLRGRLDPSVRARGRARAPLKVTPAMRTWYAASCSSSLKYTSSSSAAASGSTSIAALD